jgi:Cu/Ag efflux protein CusF
MHAFAAAIFLASPLAIAQKAPESAGAIATAPGKGVAMQATKASAVVESIDKANRSVTLKLANGETRTVDAGPDVRNFDQIKVGDTLTIKYLEAFAIELKKDGKAPLGKSEVKSMERSEPGKKPGGTATREITAVGEVVGVDMAKKHISVKNDKGQIIDLKISDPEQLKLAKKGDQIQVTYTEAVAIEMTPAAPTAPAKAPEKAPAPEKKK